MRKQHRDSFGRRAARTILMAGMLLGAGTAQAAVLFSNGPVVDANGLSILVPPQGTLGAGAQTSFNNAVADNFTVGTEGWDVTSFDVYAYQTTATSFTFTDVVWSIIAGNDVNTGALVASGTTAVTNGGQIGYRVTDTTQGNTQRPIFQINADIADLSLAAGDYFLTWSITGDSQFSGPWVPPVLGSLGSGNALQSVNGSAFVGYVDSGTSQGVDLPFAINGALGTSAVPEPGTWAMMIAGFGLVGAGMRRRGLSSQRLAAVAR